MRNKESDKVRERERERRVSYSRFIISFQFSLSYFILQIKKEKLRQRETKREMKYLKVEGGLRLRGGAVGTQAARRGEPTRKTNPISNPM